jgi:hypothetical protein
VEHKEKIMNINFSITKDIPSHGVAVSVDKFTFLMDTFTIACTVTINKGPNIPAKSVPVMLNVEPMWQQMKELPEMKLHLGINQFFRRLYKMALEAGLYLSEGQQVSIDIAEIPENVIKLNENEPVPRKKEKKK